MAAEPYTLSPITIVAPGLEKSQFETPYSTSVVDDTRAINELQVKSLPDAIRYEPGVMVQQSGIGQYSPYLRGLTGYRTLLMVDGIRLNNATMRDGPNQYWTTVDPLMIESYELIRGPTSALYGSDAVGGTLNVKTQSWRPREDGNNWGGRLYYRFGSADLSNVQRLEFGGAVGDWDMIFGGSGKDFNTLTTGGGQENPKTGYDQEAMNVKLRYHLNATDTLTLASQYDTQNDVWRTHSTIYAIPFAGSEKGSKLVRSLNQRRYLHYARYEGQDIGFMDGLSVTASFQQMAEDQLEVGGDGNGDTFNFDNNTAGFQVRANSETQIGVLDYGVEYYHDFINSDGKKLDPFGNTVSIKRQGTVADDSDYDQLGVYLQDTYRFGDFEITGGGRYNHVDLHLGKGFNDARGINVDDVNRSWNSAVGNGRILYHINKNWNVYAGVSQGWRAPTVYDLSGEEWTRSDELQTYSLGLKPEYYLTYEGGVKTRFEAVEMSAAYFYNDISNMIERAPTGQIAPDGSVIVEGRNSGRGHIQGVEFAGVYHFDENWTTFANFTWTDGSILGYPGVSQQKALSPITRMLPMNGTAGLRWNSGDGQFWGESTLTAVAQQTRLSFSDRNDTSRIPPGGTPGYLLVGLRGGWNLMKDLRTTLALENLTDEKYRVHGSGINGPGRQVVLSMDYRF